MLKFFRKYNKFILAFGAAFLMLAFLIQPTLDIFMRGPGDQPIGEVDGTGLTVADQQSAANELEALDRIHPAMGMLSRDLSEGDPLKWLLMKHDAHRMGLGASNIEVQNVLETIGRDEEGLRQLSAGMRVPPEYIHQAVRNWLMLEQYREVVLGRTHVNPVQRLQAIAYVMQAQQSGDFQLMMQGYQMLDEAFGQPRLSEPLIQHMLRDLQTTVSGQVALVEAERYLDEVEPPDEAEVQALFEQYRDVAPGQGEPYGFGYRIPARVKIEYLGVPIDRVEAQVEIDDAEAMAYFEQNRDRFREDDGENEEDANGVWTASQRRAVMQELREREAQTLANRIIRAGQGLLVQHARQLEQQPDGYRAVPADYSPPSLREVASELEEQFGVRVERYDDFSDDWWPVANLESLPGLRGATLSGRPDIRFSQYIRSAYELEPAANDPLVSLGLQAMLPSQPLEAADGSRYLFRLVDAQPAHAPETLDEVAEQVRRDAHLRKAYEEALLPRRDEWLTRARSEGFDAVVSEADLIADTLRPTPRRQPDARGQLGVPDVPLIGQSEAFIEAIFDLAADVSDNGQQPVTDAEASERIGVVEVDGRLGLALFQVDEYQPVTEDQYREMVNSSRVTSWVSQMVMGGDDDPMASLSMEAVRARVNFEPADRGSDDPPAEGPAQPQRRPGQI
ncbi:MAG: hypothetical protein WD534_00330 [Phycisphaeraceae bacterium]